MPRNLLVAVALLLLTAAASPVSSDSPDVPAYTSGGDMILPAAYREWVFLSSGLDISYDTDAAAPAGHSVFQNVFVNPTAYAAFQKTGTWPDKTILVLEIRGAAPKAGIDRRGQTQTGVRAVEVHLKDASRVPQGDHWAFFQFGTASVARLTARPASCYTCHEAHGAVDTTFVQFYPTLIDLAQSRQTLSPAYLKEVPSAQTRSAP